MSMPEPGDRRGESAGRRMSDTLSADEIRRLIDEPVKRADEDRREWRARLEALRADVQALTRSIDGVGGKLDGVSQRLERLTVKLDEHGKAIADHETRVTVIEKSLESLERTVGLLVSGARWAVLFVLSAVGLAVLRQVLVS